MTIGVAQGQGSLEFSLFMVKIDKGSRVPRSLMLGMVMWIVFVKVARWATELV
jgi:hypothetical protein